MTKLDSNNSGNIDIDEFKVWYTGSAHLVKRQIHHHFEDLIIEGHGLLDKKDTEAMLKRMGVEEIEKAEKEAHAEAKWDENDRIDREAFTDWFIQSAYLDKAMADNAEPDEGASGDALE